MKLFIKGKVFDHLDTVSVTDENGQEVYVLENDHSGLRHHIVMKDSQGTVIAHFDQPDIKVTRFVVTMSDGREVAAIEKKPKMRPSYTVSGMDWDVEGSLFSNKYKVTKGDKEIAELMVTVLKSEITIEDNEDPVVAAAVVMAIRVFLYFVQAAGAAVTAGVIGVR